MRHHNNNNNNNRRRRRADNNNRRSSIAFISSNLSSNNFFSSSRQRMKPTIQQQQQQQQKFHVTFVITPKQQQQQQQQQQQNRLLCSSTTPASDTTIANDDDNDHHGKKIAARDNNNSSNSSNNLLSLNNNIDMTGLSVKQVLKQSQLLLMKPYDQIISEPEESIIHLLSCALQLPWESNGFVLLRNILNSDDDNNSSDELQRDLSNRILTNDEWITYKHMLFERRLYNQEPIQYIVGKWDFYDFTFSIKKPLLCPRPETEELVFNHVINDINNNFNNKSKPTPIRILDVGCGTGVIGIALAKHIPNSEVIGIDIDPVAIEMSNINAQNILNSSSSSSSSYKAILSSAKDFRTIPPLSSEDDNDCTFNPQEFDVIVSNPPYIPPTDMKTLDPHVIQHESYNALCGSVGNSKDGMDVIRDIISMLPLWTSSSTESICWMEVDPSQPKLIKKMLSKTTTTTTKDTDQEEQQVVTFVDTYKDMYGKELFVKLKIN